MDRKLVAWARAVKARQRRAAVALPPLWLFTDPERLPDPIGAVDRLPKGLCGVILRGVSADEAAAIARACRGRRLAVAVAGNAQLAHRLHAGLHASNGRWQRGPRPAFVTSSAHGAADWQRACRAGARTIFLSPVFVTASHPGLQPLGARRWAGLTRRYPGRAAALGGVTGATVRALPAWCGAIGAIRAFGGLAGPHDERMAAATGRAGSGC